MGKLGLPAVAWLVFVAAAALEVGGNAVVRTGLRGSRWWVVAAGGLMLAGYGVVVNLVRWDFSRLLGVYVGVFALVSVLCGWLVFRERVPPATWAGLALIIAGGLVIQFGAK
jgi:drug/metabolite transporter superfamily protein YnfA